MKTPDHEIENTTYKVAKELNFLVNEFGFSAPEFEIEQVSLYSTITYPRKDIALIFNYDGKEMLLELNYKLGENEEESDLILDLIKKKSILSKYFNDTGDGSIESSISIYKTGIPHYLNALANGEI